MWFFSPTGNPSGFPEVRMTKDRTMPSQSENILLKFR
jgi:hypothetical protein